MFAFLNLIGLLSIHVVVFKLAPVNKLAVATTLVMGYV